MNVFEKFFNLDNLIRLGLSIGIIVSLTVFIQIITDEIFPEPLRDSFCPNYLDLASANTESSCLEIGVWIDTSNLNPDQTSTEKNNKSVGYCQEDYKCAQAYEIKLNQRKALAFSASFFLSLLVFISGVFLKSKPINIALVWTGVISLLVSLRNIPSDNKQLVAIISLFAGLILILLLSRKKIVN